MKCVCLPSNKGKAKRVVTKLGPQLLKIPNVKYLLSEVFSQDPLERHFSHQRHCGGSNDNPTASVCYSPGSSTTWKLEWGTGLATDFNNSLAPVKDT